MGSSTPLTTTLAFNSNEQMTGMALPNNIEQDAGYDGANRLSQITAQNTGNHTLLNNSYQYGYDPLGLTSAITTTVQGSAATQTLTHDAAGRLIAVRGNLLGDRHISCASQWTRFAAGQVGPVRMELPPGRTPAPARAGCPGWGPCRRRPAAGRRPTRIALVCRVGRHDALQGGRGVVALKGREVTPQPAQPGPSAGPQGKSIQVLRPTVAVDR